MRILYDGYIYDFQQYGGINRYFNEVIGRLPADATPLVSSYLGRRAFWPEHPRLRVVRAHPCTGIPPLAPLGRAWMALRSATTGADLLHPSYYLQHAAASLKRRGVPLVITVHDMIHELFADQLDPDHTIAHAKRRCIEAADAILCISEHTRQDLVARFPATARRTFVTPLASSLTVDHAAAAAYPGIDRPYFIHVGGREGYKNFTTVLEAWARFAPDHPDIRLRVVGSPWRSSEQARIAGTVPAGSVIHMGKVSDAELAILYHRSLALLYPSCYEGFGLPPLEAMRCGTAVICAAASSLPEVGGDAPLYFDPSRPDDLVVQMRTLASSSSVREQCIAKGAARAALFSWDHTAALTLDVYRRLLNR